MGKVLVGGALAASRPVCPRHSCLPAGSEGSCSTADTALLARQDLSGVTTRASRYTQGGPIQSPRERPDRNVARLPLPKNTGGRSSTCILPQPWIARCTQQTHRRTTELPRLTAPLPHSAPAQTCASGHPEPSLYVIPFLPPMLPGLIWLIPVFGAEKHKTHGPQPRTVLCEAFPSSETPAKPVTGRSLEMPTISGPSSKTAPSTGTTDGDRG